MSSDDKNHKQPPPQITGKAFVGAVNAADEIR